MSAFDPRHTPARADLAAAHLKGAVESERYAEGRVMRVVAPVADLRRAPRGDEGLDTQLLHGERFTLYEEREGWAWGQAESDSYVGYAPAEAFAPDDGAPATHEVAVPLTLAFPARDMKRTPTMSLSLGARLRVVREDERFAALAEGGFVPAIHLMPVGRPAPDFAATAALFEGVPYLWGGRTSLGLDCSGLVQLALARAGIASPRDTDQQEQALGKAVGRGELKRGDLVFWEGHVGIMLDPLRLIHANIFHMAVAIEPLAVARARIAAAGVPMTGARRLC